MRNRVLIVDDDRAVRRALERVLEREGIEAITRETGQEGIDALRDLRPDLVLLDVQLPDMSGFEICRLLKADPEYRLTPIVLITGLSSSNARLRGIEVGADDFLSKPVDLVELRARVRSLLRVKSFTDELEQAETVLFTLARSIEERDPYTAGHCERLAANACQLARGIGLSEGLITALYRGGMVHDIGKVVVPDAILLKEGPLGAEERLTMEAHPITGERICSPLKSFRHVLPIIRHHHERVDGSGYPDGLVGDRIPITARVLSVVDVYDALTTDRPYRGALSAEEALRILSEEVAQGWWDPDIFNEFRRLARWGLAA